MGDRVRVGIRIRVKVRVKVRDRKEQGERQEGQLSTKKKGCRDNFPLKRRAAGSRSGEGVQDLRRYIYGSGSGPGSGEEGLRDPVTDCYGLLRIEGLRDPLSDREQCRHDVGREKGTSYKKGEGRREKGEGRREKGTSYKKGETDPYVR